MISIIIPVFNDRPGIERTLRGLRDQTLDPSQFEVIVADNGSKDDTVQAIRAFAAQHPQISLKLLIVDKPGSYAARNAAVKVSKGEFLAFTDSECLPFPEWLAEGEALLQQGEQYVAGPIFFEFKRQPPLVAELFDTEKHLNQEVHSAHGWSATANMFTTREAFDRVGGFIEDVFSGADRLFGAQMLRAGIQAALSPGAIVYHPARNTWAAIRKKRRRVAAGMAQRHSDGTQKLLADLPELKAQPVKRLQKIPKPTPLQLPGYYLLKLICKFDQDRVTRETIRSGKAEVKFRS